jgi:hypothetical protein
MPTVELAIKNFDKQEEIFNSPARFKIAVKGRRFGLTRGAAHDFIREALEGKFKQGLWVDTVNSNIDRYVERYFIPHLKKLPENMWNWGKQAKVLKIYNSYVDFRSADRPETLEGFGYDKAFLNEAGIILKNEYLWHNAIRPMLWEFRPRTVIGGTPKGRGLFYELNQRGLDPTQEDYQSFHFTSFDNPYLDDQLLADEIKSMPEHVVKQEIYAQFIDDNGVVFRGINSITTAKPEKPRSGAIYVMGVDLAKVEDFTVIAVYDRETNKQVYQERIQKLEWPYQKTKIKGIAKHYNNALVMLDATGLGDPIADDLIRDGVGVEPVKLTNESKKQIVEKMAVWIEQGKFEVLPISETIDEFNNFTYDVTSSGRIRYAAPVGFHDDIVMAHGLAVWSLQPIILKKRPPKQPSLIQVAYARSKNYASHSEQEEYF